jgi:hypothetical protein
LLITVECSAGSSSKSRPSQKMEGISIMGYIEQYDSELSLTAQDDMIVRLKDKQKEYVRLHYSPYYGFDAPPAKPEQLLPKKEMFSNSNQLWLFKAHAPKTGEESSACTQKYIRHRKDKNGSTIEGSRYDPPPGKQTDVLPKTELLPCFIIDSWKLIRK